MVEGQGLRDEGKGLRRAEVVSVLAFVPDGFRVFFAVAGDFDRVPLRGFDQIQAAQPVHRGGPLAFAESRQRLAQTGQRLFAQSGQTIGRGRAVEQAQQAQDGDFHLAVFLQQPVFVRGEHSERVAAAFSHFAGFMIGCLKPETVALGNVRRVERQLQKSTRQRQRQSVAFHLAAGLFEFGVWPCHAVSLQHGGSGCVGEMVERSARRGRIFGRGQVGDRLPSRNYAQPATGRLQPVEQREQAIVLEFSRLRPGRMLQRLQPVQNQQRAVLRGQSRQSRPLVPRRSRTVSQF